MRSIRWPTVLMTLALISCTKGALRPAKTLGDQRELDRRDAPATAPAPGLTASTSEGGVPEGAESGTLPQAAADPTVVPSMVIRTGQASLRVDSLEPAVVRVRQLAARLGGYVANSQVQAGENQLRSATLELKVPAIRFDEATSGLSPIGKVEYVNVAAEDVGEEFTDIGARVANAHRLEQRLIDLLTTRTGKLSDVLQVEHELARVREEIERMEGRLRYLKTRVATSTLSVTVHEPAPLVGTPGSGGVVAAAFREAWRNLVNFVAGLIASLGFLIPVGVLVVGALFAVRRLWRARRGGKA